MSGAVQVLPFHLLPRGRARDRESGADTVPCGADFLSTAQYPFWECLKARLDKKFLGEYGDFSYAFRLV